MIGSYGAFNTYYHNNNLKSYPLYVPPPPLLLESTSLLHTYLRTQRSHSRDSDGHDTNRSVTAWIGSLQSCLVFTLAILGGSWFDKYGPRPLMVFGTVTSAAGYLALSWVGLSSGVSGSGSGSGREGWGTDVDFLYIVFCGCLGGDSVRSSGTFSWYSPS